MKKAIYIMIMGVTIYLGIIYEWQTGVWLLSGEISFLLFCVVSSFYFSRKLKIHMDMEKVLIEQKEKCNVTIQLHNRSNFPMTVKVVLVYKYLSGKKEKRSAHYAYLGGKQNRNMACSFVPEYCGKIEIRTKKVLCYDFIGIFTKSKKINEKVITTVMPKPYPVNLIVSNRTRWFPIDGESYAQDRGGEDAAEIYDVREYQAGDRMQKVHWKLSAREDLLYIKEFSYPLGAAVVFMLEKSWQRSECGHDFIEAVISIASALVEADCPHYVVWKKKAEDRVKRMLIRSEEDLYEFIVCVLEFERDCLEENMEECYRYEYKNDTYSTLLKIDTNMMMQINKNEAVNMLSMGLEAFFGETEIVV